MGFYIGKREKLVKTYGLFGKFEWNDTKNYPCLVCILTSKVDRFLQWGSMAKIFTCCQIQMKVCGRVCLKRLNDWGMFEFDRARNKNNSTGNLFALASEKDSSIYIEWNIS